MKQKEQIRTRNLTVRVSIKEYAALQEKFQSTTHRFFSDYIRAMIHQAPITVWNRSKSLDEFLPVAIAIKNELQTMGKSINHALKKLNTLPLDGDGKETLANLAEQEGILRQKIGEIKNTLIKMHEKWSQE
jgi:hypothetical protein